MLVETEVVGIVLEEQNISTDVGMSEHVQKGESIICLTLYPMIIFPIIIEVFLLI